MALPEFLQGENNGRERTLAPRTSAFQGLLKAESKRNVEPLLLNINWGIEFIDESVPAAPSELEVIGELEWGVTGAVHKIQFDWGRGGQLNISTVAVHLKVAYPSASGPTVRVFASLAPGTRGATEANRVTLTKHHPSTLAGYIEAVPRFARTVSVFTAEQPLFDADLLVIELLGVDQTVRYRHFARNNLPIELPNNIFFVRLINNGAFLGPIQTALCFGLAI